MTAAFFRRPEVLEAIDSIRLSSQIVVYAGAGVSIDKSGLSWSHLIEELLALHVPKAKARRAFVKNSGPLFAASAAHQFFIETSPEPEERRLLDARQRMVDVLRPLLYGPSLWRGGELANAIADFVYISNNRQKSGSSAPSHTASLVTTNYDDYLFSALVTAHDINKAQRGGSLDETSPPRVRFPTRMDPLLGEDGSPARWVTDSTALRSETSCVHLHGFLPRSRRKGAPERMPVVSEHDYFITAEHSENALTVLFRDADVIIAGASLTDPPLLRALEATRNRGQKRWALIDLESGTQADPSGADQRRMIKSRLNALGVTPIFVDYHVQQAQFFRELIAAKRLSARAKYGSSRNKSSYYARLASWWKRLRIESSRSRTDEMQYQVHDFLASFVLPECKSILEARAERMKIEIWIRWDPSNERIFRLFGSTVGVWVDYDAMRIEEIAMSTESIIVDTFREGRPQLRSDSSYGGRWPTVLAVPIWSEAHQTEFVTSVVLLASQSESDVSSLDEERNRASLADCTRFLHDVGNYLTDPDSWKTL